jgi:acyl-CoA synthetase (AMP-forming)/AMP-acid ligase II
MRTTLLLDLVADTAGDRVAIDGPGGTLTYAALRQATQAFAAHAVALAGENVGYLGMNAPALPVALFGAGYAGRTFCPLNYRLPDEALRRLATRLAPALIVADDDMIERLRGLDRVTLLRSSEVLLLPPPAEPVDVGDEGAEVAVLLFTSGTSGEPKAATLKHLNLTSYVLQAVEMIGTVEDEAMLVSAPPYHIAGISAFLTSVYAGRRIIQLPTFEPQTWVDAAERFAATHAMLVPTMFGRVLDVVERNGTQLTSMRAISYGGGRMPVETIARGLKLLERVAFVNAYGLTETSSTISLLGPEDHDLARRGDPVGLKRLGSVGRPIPSVDVEIRGESGQPVAVGEAGEVWVRGEQVSGEYVGRKVVDDEGWFPTRDRGWIDADGYLYLDGRLDDIIVRGGENISPGEIEDVLRQHPAVADAAVIGAPDAQWGERIVAFAVLVLAAAATAEELRDFVRVRLRSTKAPEQVLFRPELPYNETGKLLRRQLRDELARIGGG